MGNAVKGVEKCNAMTSYWNRQAQDTYAIDTSKERKTKDKKENKEKKT